MHGAGGASSGRVKIDLIISDKTHLALARTKEAVSDGEMEIEGKLFVDYLTVDIIKAMLEPVVGQVAWIAWAQETARRFTA